MTARRKKPAPVLDTPEENMHVVGPILWTLVVYAVAGLLDVFNVAALHVALFGFPVTVLGVMVAIYKRYTFLQLVALTAFLTWTTATTPWARDPALVAAGGAVIFGMSYHALRKREKTETEQETPAEALAERGKYELLIERVGVKGLREKSRAPFPAGKTITLRLPSDGSVTLKKLIPLADAMATATDEPDDTYQFERGESAGTVKLHVYDRDVLAETVPLPFDRRAKSIHEPIQLGLYKTGEVAMVTFREVAALMVGLKGKGKSALINTHLAHLTGCPDAVVWMLDGKGGRTARPWIDEFLSATTGRPCIDWVAIDSDESDAMLIAVNAAIKVRSKGNGDKIEPTPEQPSIILIVEEASVITGVGTYGNANRASLAQRAVVQGRSEAVDALFATQRATVTMLGNGDMKSNLDLIYGLGVTRPEDARMIFPDGAMAETLYRLGDATKYRGVFLMQSSESSRVMPAKGYWVDPDNIRGMARTNSEFAGTLDRETADAVETALREAGVPGGYVGRWDRLRKMLGRDGGTSQAETVGRDAGTPETRDGETVGRDGGTSQPSRGATLAQEAMERSRAERERQRFEDLMRANGFGETAETGEDETVTLPKTVPPILRLMLAVFVSRDADRLPTKVLCDDLPGTMNPQLMGRLMGHCNVSSVETVSADGKRARGYERDAIETAIKGQSWTARAFDWEP